MQTFLSEQDEKSLEGYTRVAPKYDENRYGNIEGSFAAKQECAIFVDLIRPDFKKKILDVGTGTGKVAIALAENGGQIIAVDLAENMLKIAQRKAKEENIVNIAFQIANAKQLPFEDNSFDVVTSSKFLHLFPFDEKLLVIQEMKRVLKPEGQLIIQFNTLFSGLRKIPFRLLKGDFLYFKRRASHLLWPFQLRRLFDGMEVRKIIGIKLPFSGRLSQWINENFVIQINRNILKYSPFKYLSDFILVEAVKQ